jgi:hypothetical protein
MPIAGQEDMGWRTDSLDLSNLFISQRQWINQCQDVCLIYTNRVAIPIVSCLGFSVAFSPVIDITIKMLEHSQYHPIFAQGYVVTVLEGSKGLSLGLLLTKSSSSGNL